MVKQLNFNNVKKQYLTVTLADEKNTVLLIGTPTKAILDHLSVLQDGINSIGESEANEETLNDLYAACAMVMSRNKAGVKITPEFVAETFDFEDIILFFSSYMDFVSEVANQKN